MAQMTPYLLAATVLAGVNVLLLLALSVVWGRNYREFRTPMTLGLLAFALVLLVENLVAIGFFFSMGMLYAGSGTAQLAVLGMRAMQAVALSFLASATFR